MDRTTSQSIVEALRNCLPAGNLLWEQEDTAPYECDGLAAYRTLPLAVALPEDAAQVQAVLLRCHALGVPVVPRGAGTGLSGGATPIAECIVLSTAKLNRILDIDPLSRRAVLQPGVRNLAISEAAAPYGLYYAPDPSSQIACTIGGNVAENSGGVHCLKYGLTVNNVIQVRAVLMDGEPVTFGAESLDAPGLDLLGVIIGSEGMLAVVTEVTVRLIPRPPMARVIMASFDDTAQAGQAVAAVIAAGLIPAGLEMMDKMATRAVEAFVHAGYDTDAEALLLCESDGTAEEVEEEIERMSRVLSRSGAERIRVSETEAERSVFWSGRKNAFPAAGRIAPDYYCMDGTVPKKHLAALLHRIQAMGDRYGLQCMNVFHAGDGNLHPLILFDGSAEDQWRRAEAFGHEILETCVALGGVITGEHGVGIEKLDAMCVQFDDRERAAFLGVKAAFDPARLLNPGKAIPSLHRCAEFGRLHVHHGQLPHAGLPRF